MAFAKFTLKKNPATTRFLNQYPQVATQALRKALFQEGEGIMAQAKALTPVDTGNLRASGHVEPPKVEGNKMTVELGFGGIAGSPGGNSENVGYAIIVHENLAAAHPVGMAKYLEIPFNAAKSGMAERVGRDVKAAVRRLKV